MEPDSETSKLEAEQLQKGLQVLQAVIEGHKQIVQTTRLCFDRCVSYPGKVLSSSQQVCVWNCAQRFAEASFFIKSRSMEKLKSGEFLTTFS